MAMNDCPASMRSVCPWQWLATKNQDILAILLLLAGAYATRLTATGTNLEESSPRACGWRMRCLSQSGRATLLVDNLGC